MTVKTAEKLLPCHLAGDGSNSDSSVVKAVRLAERNDALKSKLQVQEVIDQRVLQLIESLPIPAQLKEKVRAMEASAPPNIWKAPPLKNPAVLAALISLLVLALLLIRGAMGRAENFPGREVAVQLIEESEEMNGVEFEPVPPTELGRLNDWFAMNGMDGFAVPRGFTNLKVAGCRVFKRSGFPIAEALVEQNETIVYVFNAADFGITLDPPEKWRALNTEGRVAAIRRVGDMCFLVTFRGTEQQMQDLLRSRAD